MSLSLARRGVSPWFKACLAAALVVLADVLIFDRSPGSSLALAPLAAFAAVILAHPAVRRDRRARLSLCAAALGVLLLADRPSFVGWMLAWIALAVAVLSPRAPSGETALQWAVRLVWAGLAGLRAPFVDLLRMLERRIKGSLLRALLAAILPLAGGLVFFWLFALANPVIDAWLESWRLPEVSFVRLVFWAFCAYVAWILLRPRGLRRQAKLPARLVKPLPVGGSVVASLIVFNAVFAIQNLLDLAFLWSGAPLPQGVSFAEYAHRGAYLLIVTALLAGAFVLLFLRPGAPGADRPVVRRLVTLWVAQNLILVASSVLRTLDYVEAYGLTRLRISALAWMGLVALGLVLICARLLRNRSAAWLVNWNFAAMTAVLVAAAATDLAAPAAFWNVRHPREIAGRPPTLDLCYLRELGDAAILPLLEVESGPASPRLRATAAYLRIQQMSRLRVRQGDWRTWTWRGQRRLAAAERAVAAGGRPTVWAGPILNCDGSVYGRPVIPPLPLTPPASARS